MHVEIPYIRAVEQVGVLRDNLFVTIPEDKEGEVLDLLRDLGLYDQQAHVAEMDKRAAAFEARTKNPPPPYEPTKAELQAMRAEKAAEVAALDVRIVAKG